MYQIKTPRLGLRSWQASDIDPMTSLNQDQEVMQHFPSIQDRKMTAGFVDRMQKHQAEHGFCYFAVDLLETNEFLGFIGLCHQNYESPYTPHVDIGWRLKRSCWGQGLAPEGAKACLEFAFNQLNIPTVYAVATLTNVPSQRVMEKIGMERLDTFVHPKLLDNERLRDCVVYGKEGSRDN